MVDRILNRPSNNYIFTGSRLRAGTNNSDARLRLSTANNESIIDLCNNGNVDISASSVFINGLKVVTTSNGDATSLTSLQLAQNLDVSGLISSDGGIRIGSGVFGGTITKSSTIHEIVIDPFGIDGSTSTSQDLSWIQLGQDIDGEAPNDNFGSEVSINAAGNIVAIGTIYNDGNGDTAGHVRIYQYNNNANDPSWIQMGQDIDGEVAGDKSATSISLNAAGTIIAIGAEGNDGSDITNTQRGHVRLYQYNNNANDPSWIQMGQDINGEAPGDNSGFSVSLNATGNIVAIGAPINAGNGSYSGHVRVYQYNNNVNDPSWIQMGLDINGEAAYDYSGYSISLNNTGNILAIGAPYNDGNGSNSGHVRIYQYNNNVNDPSWIQLGADINSAASFGNAAYVSLNAAGTILAIGAPSISRGKVKMYQYNNNANDPSWIQLGPDINGETEGNYSGRYISLNDAGNILAIGSPYNNGINGEYSGHVRLYQYNNNVNDPSWIQMGLDIDGEAAADYAARVSLNAAGNIVIIGGPYNDGNGNSAGHVRIYKLQEPVSAVTDASGQVVIMGDLVVRGNTTTIFSTIVDISDLLLTLASGSTTALKSNNAGFQLGDGYASLLYDSSANRWKTNIGLNISGGLTGNSGITFNGNMLPLNNVSRLPVTFNTFACVTLPLIQDLLYGDVSANTWMDASGYVVGTQVLSNYSYIKIDLKVAYTSSPEAYQTLGFRVLRGATDGSGVNYSSTPVFSDISLGSNTGITSNNIYNGIYYDNLNGAVLTNNTLYYKLQFRRDCPSTTTISRPFGIRGSTGNYFAIQELYNLISSNTIIESSNIIIDYANSTITQFGLDILGEADTTYSGYNVALSEDGTIMAISAPYNNGTGTLRGSTRIYQYNNIDISWVQLGPDIDGEADNDQQTNVKLSKDGTIVAVSSFANSGTGSVRVFKYNAIDISWIKQGQDIDGTGAGDEFAKSFSLSANGKIIAIGATKNDTSYNNAGQVLVYSYNDVSWNKIGTFNGFGPDAMTGESVSLSSSGTILAISSLPPQTSSSFPRVNIYELSNNVWSPKGPTIFAPYDSINGSSRYGKIIELSSDGTIIAINDRFTQNTNYGRVLVYKYTSIDNSWNKLGSDVSGAVVAQNGSIDPYIALSADGTIMAVGYVSDSTYKGLVRLYKFINNNWVKIGSDLIGDSTYSYFGNSLALSSNGSILAVGNPLNSPSNSGLVRTYKLNYAYT